MTTECSTGSITSENDVRSKWSFVESFSDIVEISGYVVGEEKW